MKNNNQGNSVHKKGMATQEAYERIKKLISVNEFAPGQKLIYSDMAKKLNMGVTPVIQALNRLESSNLVKYVPNKGYSLEVFIIPAVIQNIDSKKLDEIRQFFKKRRDVRRPRREVILEDTMFHFAIVRYADNDVIYNLLEHVFEQVYLKYRPEYLTDDRIRVLVKEHRAILNSLVKGNVEETVVSREGAYQVGYGVYYREHPAGKAGILTLQQ